MVDSQTCQNSFPEQPENKPVGPVKYIGQLHSQSGEVIDVEKTPVVDIVRSDAKIGTSPVLRGNQRLQFLPARKRTGAAIESLNGNADLLACIAIRSR